MDDGHDDLADTHSNPRKRKSNGAKAGGDVCRDFLRNVCTRGSKCRFAHPASDGGDDSTEGYGGGERESCGLQDTFVFCHDFQNRQQDCSRPHCRFLHCTREEQEQFHASGYLPPHLRDQAVRKGIAPDLPTHFGTRPICKDHLKGECHRASCKFRHVSAMEYDLEIGQGRGAVYEGVPPHQQLQQQQREDGTGYLFERRSMPEDRHRRMAVSTPLESDVDPRWFPAATAGGHGETEHLRQENMFLSQRLQELKKQVHDLTTTNEFLLEQNAQLRVKAATSAAVAAASLSQQMSVPAASVVSMSVQQQPTVSVSLQQEPLSCMSATSMSAVATMQQQPTATITMATLDTGCAPSATVSLPVQPVSCCHAQEITHVQPVSAAGNVHVQETRLVTFPITSIRQAM